MGQRSDIGELQMQLKRNRLDQAKHIQLFSFINDLSPISVHNYKKDSFLR